MNRKLLYVLCHAVMAEGVATNGGAAAAAPMLPVPTEPKESSFHFKKEKIKAEDGKVIGEGKKHPSLKLSVPVPTDEGILAIIQNGGKQLELLREVVKETLENQVRLKINELKDKLKEGEELKAENINTADLTWEAIASMPKTDRRSLGISEEDWEAFFLDYRAIMPKVTGKDADRIEKHVQLFKKKFQPTRNDKKALAILKDVLTLWAANTSTMEENADVYEYLSKRVDVLLQEEEKVLADAL